MKRILRFRAVNRDIFEQIRTGKKRVETRAASPSYRKISAGDELIFVCGQERFSTRVQRVRHFDSIESLLKQFTVNDIMPTLSTREELLASYHSYPHYRERLKLHGLLAFELE